MSTRRDALKTIAGVAAAPVLAAQQHAHPPGVVQVATPGAPKVFNKQEFAVLTRLADAIIPRSETPGAADAGVPFYIDREAAKDEALARRLREGLAWLAEKNFLALSPVEQIALLTPISRETASDAGKFFHSVKDLTVDGYYTSREGLVTELGWNANTFLPEFKGCTHPEHQG